MKYSEISELSKKDLRLKINELRRSLFENGMKNKMGQLANPLSLRHARRDIARLKTALRSQELKAEVKK
jgi:large subunit ribosomal protein L29